MDLQILDDRIYDENSFDFPLTTFYSFLAQLLTELNQHLEEVYQIDISSSKLEFIIKDTQTLLRFNFRDQIFSISLVF